MTPRALSVEAVHADVRRLLDGRLRRVAGSGAVVVLAWGLLLAWLGARLDGSASSWPLAVDLLMVGALGVGFWAFRRVRARTLDSAAIARGMERAAGLPDGLVRSGLELGRGLPSGVSSSLAGMGVRRLAARLDAPVETLAGAAGRDLAILLRRVAGAAVVLVPLVAALAVLSPDRARAGWSGLLSPVSTWRGPSRPPLQVSPGDVELVRGAPLEIRVAAVARDSVTLRWQSAGDVARTRALPVVDGVANHRFDAVTADMVYRLEAPDGARSEDFTVTPRDPLFVSDVQVRLLFPPHTGRLEEEYRGDVPSLRIPVGTRILVEGHGSRPLGSASLTPVSVDSLGVESARAGEPVEFALDGAGFSGGWAPRRGGVWSWSFTDANGEAAELRPGPLELALIPDGAPTVAITFPSADTLLPLNLRQPLVVQASDDYGVAWMELVAWRVTALGEAREPVTQRLDLGDSRVVLARPLMDLSSWGLIPGDEVRYFVRVVDNAPAGQEARSVEHVLRMPEASALQREAQNRLDQAAEELAALAEETRRSAEETRELEQRARAPDRSADETPTRSGDESVAFEEREGLDAALEEQRERAAQVDSLRRELGQMSETLSEAGAQDEGLRRDLADLQDLLEELAGPEMEARLDELAERMSDLDRREAQEALDDLASEEEQFRERLEEALERMRRAAAQQDFRSTTQEAEELAEQERALAEAMQEEPSGERAEQQDALQAEAEAMDESMEALAERLRELGEDQAADGVEQARAEAQAAAQSMSEAAQSARSGEAQQAGEQGQQAASAMDEAAREMMEAQQRMMQERAQAFQQALEQTSQDALSLARRQAEIREAMQGANPEAMAELRGQAAGLGEGARTMAENLSIAAEAAQAGGGERPVSEALGQAMASLEQVVSALDRPSGRTLSP
ncbi:MAG: hypothetical protein KJP18_01280, partial [Gemmatimonadetes bacterium]|nr:hypothetical protein [Gemmatimonadota bacterium]